MVNADALSGAPGLRMASWLVEQGIDASWVSQGGGSETWAVVFNPSVVCRAEKTPSAAIDWANADFPSFAAQRRRLVEGETSAPASEAASPRRRRP